MGNNNMPPTSSSLRMDPKGRPDLKVKRAREHFAELEHAIDAYRAGGNFHVEQTANGRSIDFTLRIDFAAPVEDWALVFGDSVHNLRAALDHLAWQLDAKPGKDSEFPIFVKPPTKWPPPSVAKMPAKAREIIRGLQPYEWASGGNPTEHLLAVLHSLDIQDKHRFPAVAVTVVRGDRIEGLPFGASTDSTVFPRFVDGESIMRVRVPDDAPPTTVLKCEIFLDVILGDLRQPAPALDVLEQLFTFVRESVLNPLMPFTRS
jgi:hypothetical protein